MIRRYIYKSKNDADVRVRGYHFYNGKELKSNIIIRAFQKAVDDGILTLTDILKPEEPSTPPTKISTPTLLQDDGSENVIVTITNYANGAVYEIAVDGEVDDSIQISNDGKFTIARGDTDKEVSVTAKAQSDDFTDSDAATITISALPTPPVKLDTPTLTSDDADENDAVTITITNYDETAEYEVIADDTGSDEDVASILDTTDGSFTIERDETNNKTVSVRATKTGCTPSEWASVTVSAKGE